MGIFLKDRPLLLMAGGDFGESTDSLISEDDSLSIPSSLNIIQSSATLSFIFLSCLVIYLDCAPVSLVILSSFCSMATMSESKCLPSLL